MSDTPVAATAVQVTRAGFERLQQELAALRTERRPAVARDLQRARLFLNPQGNAATVVIAESELELIDQRIADLEDLLEKAQVIGDGPPSSTVRPGSRVTVRYEDGTEETLTLVGPLEANAASGRVSIDSPAGKALLGKRSGNDAAIGDGDRSLALQIVSIDAPRETA